MMSLPPVLQGLPLGLGGELAHLEVPTCKLNRRRIYERAGTARIMRL
jgi:hypothetical protein